MLLERGVLVRQIEDFVKFCEETAVCGDDSQTHGQVL